MFYLSRRRRGYPHVNFCILVDPDQNVAKFFYLPISSACPAIDGTTNQEEQLSCKSFKEGNWLILEMYELVTEFDVNVEQKLESSSNKQPMDVDNEDEESDPAQETLTPANRTIDASG